MKTEQPADAPPFPTDWKYCPRCGSDLDWDEVDNGVGTERGNPGCPDCHWVPGEPDVVLDDERLKALAAGAILQKQHVLIAALTPLGRVQIGFAANLIRELATRHLATLAAAQGTARQLEEAHAAITSLEHAILRQTDNFEEENNKALADFDAMTESAMQARAAYAALREQAQALVEALDEHHPYRDEVAALRAALQGTGEPQ